METYSRRAVHGGAWGRNGSHAPPHAVWEGGGGGGGPPRGRAGPGMGGGGEGRAGGWGGGGAAWGRAKRQNKNKNRKRQTATPPKKRAAPALLFAAVGVGPTTNNPLALPSKRPLPADPSTADVT
jgi:hypothetical protein